MTTPRKPVSPEIPKTANDPEQSERFIETARKHGADKSDKEFKRLFNKIVPPTTKKKRNSS